MNELLIWIIALLIFIGIPVFFISKRKMKRRSQKWIYIKAAFYGLLSAFSIPILIMILVLCITIKNDYFPPKKHSIRRNGQIHFLMIDTSIHVIL